jgi:hypothetical protein
MQKFSEILPTLENTDHVLAVELFDASGQQVARIDNVPGSSGSVRVYCHLAKQWGVINAEAARAGLQLYAEHTEDARANPGKHPNIDRLLALQENAGSLQVKLVPKSELP